MSEKVYGKEVSMKIKLDQGAYMPSRAHNLDAGYDLRAIEGKTVPANGSAEFDTGVHIQLPANAAGMVVSKSGLNIKHDITSCGLIDPGYTGSIRVKLYNQGGQDYTVSAGDKISQLLIVPFLTPDLDVVDELDESERGDSGFGSTGR